VFHKEVSAFLHIGIARSFLGIDVQTLRIKETGAATQCNVTTIKEKKETGQERIDLPN